MAGLLPTPWPGPRRARRSSAGVLSSSRSACSASYRRIAEECHLQEIVVVEQARGLG